MKLLPVIVLAASAVLASACGGGPAIEAANQAINGCDWTDYILVSQDDTITEGTADQILAHNETREDLCE